jgi:hypothetical protein
VVVSNAVALGLWLDLIKSMETEDAGSS